MDGSSDLLRCIRRASVAAVGCLALALPLTPAHAGFFDFLFPPQAAPQTAAPYYAPTMSHRFGHQLRKPRSAALRHKLKMANIHHGQQQHVTSLDFMDDDSLRDGDAVMTPSGIRIFVGSSDSHHSNDDFAKLSEIKGISRRERDALVAIDAHLWAAGEPHDRAGLMVTGRSVADATLSPGSIITDSKGRRIRYVGP